jgi:hypothetical protein
MGGIRGDRSGKLAAMQVPHAEQAEVPERKVTEYLLALASEDGHGKAAFFLSRGFALNAWQVFAAELRNHVRTLGYTDSQPTKWGVKYVVDGPLQCPDGGTANVRTIWNITPPAVHPRLITAHPLPRLRG